jgi:apolipoprotein D and lipocalin family protein
MLRLFYSIFLFIFITTNCSNSKKESEPIYKDKILFPLLLGVITYYSDSQFSKYALDTIDLSKYAGLWYEIERIPNSFQGDLANVKATYTPRSDGNLTVYNEGTLNGSTSNISGVGIPSALPRAILKVSFFYPIIFSDYYVIGLDKTNYSHAMVGGPVPNILWILSRESTLSETIINTYKESAKAMGYNTSLLKSYIK